MRIFIGIDIDDGIRQRIQRFMEGVREFAPDARWVRPESLHVTLKFIGEQPDPAVEQIQHALAEIKGLPMPIAFRGCGYFPTPKAARVFWVGIEADASLASLAQTVDQTTARLAIPAEDRPFSPHLTLARGGGGSGAPGWKKGDRPNRQFQLLQEKLNALPPPEFGTMTAREFVLYRSQLLRGGAQYSKLARFALVA
jgi:RNA 2',3'-cyclic 3'-phosphodiesterase